MKLFSRTIIAAILAVPAVPAVAHPGHGANGFAAGIAHPLTGLDHLSAMVMIGLWAGLVGGRATWMLPAAFLTAMLAGFGLGIVANMGAGGLETAIIASVLVLGIAIALTWRARLRLAVTAAAIFGFAHGMAHGLEAPDGPATLGFACGFLVVTALLHVLGLQFAARMPAALVRALGAAGVCVGLLLVGTA